MSRTPKENSTEERLDAEQAPSPVKPKSRFFAHWKRLSWTARIAALPVYFYRIFISPLTPKLCRHEPSCSVYALEALSRHGAIKGTWLALRRLLRCHPFESLGGTSGYDPVPERRAQKAAPTTEKGQT